MIARRLSSIVMAALLVAALAPAPALAAVPTASAGPASTDEDTDVGVTLAASDPDGTAIDHFTVVVDPTRGTLGTPTTPSCDTSNPPICTAMVTYTPDPDENGLDSFEFTATDSDTTAETSANATASITINAVNDAPVAVGDPGLACSDGAFGESFPIVEDYGPFVQPGVGACGLGYNDTDTDGDPLTFELVSPPTHGSATVMSDGGWAYTPGSNFSTPSGSWPSDSFAYRVFDGTAYSAPATMQLWIAPVNDAPTFTSGTSPVIVAEDSGPYSAAWASSISPGAPYEATQSVTFQVSVPPPDQALFSTQPAISPAGTLTFQPAPNALGLTTVTVTAKDNGGLESYPGVTIGPRDTSDPVQLQIAVTSSNDAPTANDDTAAVAEDSGTTPIDVLANDTDPDAGETLTVTGVSRPANGTSAVTSTGVSYAPLANYQGSDSFTYTVSDGSFTDTATVNLTVTSVNDPPTANDDTVAPLLEDAAPVVISVLANDSFAPDTGETLTITLAVAGTKGSVSITGGGTTVTYDSNTNANGSDSFTYTVSDGHGGTDTATVHVSITAVNDPPTAGTDTLNVDEDSGNTTMNVVANDSSLPDGGEAVSLVSVDDAIHGTTAVVAGSVRYRPDGNYNGPDSFTYTISDGVLTAQGTVNVTVRPVNDNPVAVTDTPTVAEDSVANVIDVLANDTTGPDIGETLSVAVVSNPPNGTAAVTAGIVTYTPDPGYNGADTFTYILSDGKGGTATGTVNATVIGSNDPPTANDDTPAAILEDAGATIINVLGNDTIAPDAGETLAVTVVGTPAKGTAAVTTGGASVTYTPATNANGADSFSYTISDGNGGTDTATVSIMITPVNDAPSFTKGANETVLEDPGLQTVAGWATGMSAGPLDESAQTLSFSITNDNNALFSVQPAVAANGTLTYTPAANQYGSAIVSVRINDTGGTANGGVSQSAIQTFTIAVTAVNDAPSFTKGANQGDLEDAGPQAVAGWATVITAGPLEAAQTVTFEVTSNTNPGLFSAQPAVAANGTLSYTPAANANGTATIGVRITDTGGTASGGTDASASQTFTVTVTAVNDAPSFTKGADQTDLEDAGLQTVAGWAVGMSAGPADEAGQALTFAVTSNTNAALFSAAPAINATTGTLTYTAAANANGSATITIQLSDNGGTANGGDSTSDAQSFTITVTAVNDVPSFTKGPDQTDVEDAGAQTVTPWATAISRGPANESAQSLNFLIVSNTNTALFSTQPAIAANGTLSYTPAANAQGTATIEVRLVDGGGTANGGQDSSGAQSFSITVTSVNDAPSFTRGADQPLLEDAGAQTVAGWATGMSAGPADEAGQSLAFQIASNTNAALFSVQPALAVNGTLTYTPAANANGSATVQVRITDSGGTANGGVNASAIQTLAITIAPVNDAPTFTKGADQGAPEDAALQTVPGWATGISAGPADESGQVLAFEIIANTNPDLFAVQPAIEAATGTLTYDPATNRTGTTTIEVRLTDNGGVAGGGDDTSATETFTITVAGANDPPIAANDLATVRLGGPAAINVRANDSGGPNEAGDSYLITAVREGSRGIVTITGGGTGLTYDPMGCTTGTDTFSYTLTDGGGQTDTATVLVTIANPSPYPVVDGPRPFFVTNSTIGSTTPIKLTWCGLTSGTTIRSYRLYQSRSSGAFTTLISSTTARSTTRSLSGSPTTYLFKARVTDNKGRIAYGAGPRFRVLRYQDASSSVTYSSGWSKSSTSSALGGTTRYTKSAGKSAQLTYTGRSFAIVGTKGSTRGSFNVYVDGARVTSTAVSTRTGSTLYRRVLYQRSMPFGIHTVKIVAVGNGRIDLDAILAIAAG